MNFFLSKLDFSDFPNVSTTHGYPKYSEIGESPTKESLIVKITLKL